MKKLSNWASGVGQKIRHRLLVLLRIRLHPNNTDSLRLDFAFLVKNKLLGEQNRHGVVSAVIA